MKNPIAHINLISRHNIADEYSVMIEALNAIPNPFPGIIRQVFCDSKACACYEITITENASARQGKLAADAFHTALLNGKQRGHNGIAIVHHHKTIGHLPPWWAGDIGEGGC